MIQWLVLQKLLPIMEKHNVDVYICGHDHNLQHLRNVTGNSLDFVVTGGGGAPLYAYRPDNDLELMEVSSRQLFKDRYSVGIMNLRLCESIKHIRQKSTPLPSTVLTLVKNKRLPMHVRTTQTNLINIWWFQFSPDMNCNRVGPTQHCNGADSDSSGWADTTAAGLRASDSY